MRYALNLLVLFSIMVMAAPSQSSAESSAYSPFKTPAREWQANQSFLLANGADRFSSYGYLAWDNLAMEARAQEQADREAEAKRTCEKCQKICHPEKAATKPAKPVKKVPPQKPAGKKVVGSGHQVEPGNKLDPELHPYNDGGM